MNQPGGAFASDNWSGAQPAVMEAVMAANTGHVPAYGADPVTEEATALVRHHFGDGAHVYFAFTGTGANIIGLQSLLRPYEAVVCASGAHINTDECGTPERFLGSKLLAVDTPDGKLTPELVA